MNTLGPHLARLNPEQLISLASLVISKLAPAPPDTPPLPNLAEKVEELRAAQTAAREANDAYEAAKAALASAKVMRDVAIRGLRDQHKVVVLSVQSEAKGKAALLAASGYPIAAVAGPPSRPGQIGNLAVSEGRLDGSVEVSYNPGRSIRTYEVQLTTGDSVQGPWMTVDQPTTSTVTLPGLTSGQRVWVRVRGIGTRGPGPWSDPATKIVP